MTRPRLFFAAAQPAVVAGISCAGDRRGHREWFLTSCQWPAVCQRESLLPVHRSHPVALLPLQSVWYWHFVAPASPVHRQRTAAYPAADFERAVGQLVPIDSLMTAGFVATVDFVRIADPAVTADFVRIVDPAAIADCVRTADPVVIAGFAVTVVA